MVKVKFNGLPYGYAGRSGIYEATAASTPIEFKMVSATKLYDSFAYGAETNSICQGSKYALTTSNKIIDKTGAPVADTEEPMVIEPVGVKNIYKNIPFTANIYHGYKKVDTVKMTLEGDDFPVLLGTCVECGCPEGYTCNSTTGDCELRKNAVICDGTCGGTCDGECASPDKECKFVGGAYSCIEKDISKSNITITIIASILILLFLGICILAFSKHTRKKSPDPTFQETLARF